jgi:hypothetical protein
MRIAIISASKLNEEIKLRQTLLEAIREWKPSEITELILVKGSPINEQVIKIADSLQIAHAQVNSVQEALVKGDAILCFGEVNVQSNSVANMAHKLKKPIITKNT